MLLEGEMIMAIKTHRFIHRVDKPIDTMKDCKKEVIFCQFKFKSMICKTNPIQRFSASFLNNTNYCYRLLLFVFCSLF